MPSDPEQDRPPIAVFPLPVLVVLAMLGIIATGR